MCIFQPSMLAEITPVMLTFASSVWHHDRLVLTLDARQTVLGLGTFETVARTSATVALVEHVLVIARLAPHRRHAITSVSTRQTVERTLWYNNSYNHVSRSLSLAVSTLFALKSFYSKDLQAYSSNTLSAIDPIILTDRRQMVSMTGDAMRSHSVATFTTLVQ